VWAPQISNVFQPPRLNGLLAQSRPVTNPHTWRAEPIQRPNTDQLLAIVQILDSQD
jgi:hypothetical protein